MDTEQLRTWLQAQIAACEAARVQAQRQADLHEGARQAFAAALVQLPSLEPLLTNLVADT